LFARKFTTIKQISAPTTLALGTLFAGRTKTGEITVQNVSPTQSLTFSAVGEHFSFGGTQPYTIPANSSMQLAYTFSIPTDLGAYSGVITFTQPIPLPGSVLTIQVSGTVVEDPTISTLPFFEGFEVGNTDASTNIKNWTQVTDLNILQNTGRRILPRPPITELPELVLSMQPYNIADRPGYSVQLS
jgi:hypothetical protein